MAEQGEKIRRSVRGGLMAAAGAGPAFADLREEIVALVVHQNEGGEVLHLNLPDGFHAQFRVFQQFHLPDVILGQDGGGTADGTQVKAAVLLAGVRHLLAAVALGDHDHRAALGLEEVHIGVHAVGGRRTHGAAGVAFGFFSFGTLGFRSRFFGSFFAFSSAWAATAS